MSFRPSSPSPSLSPPLLSSVLLGFPRLIKKRLQEDSVDAFPCCSEDPDDVGNGVFGYFTQYHHLFPFHHWLGEVFPAICAVSMDIVCPSLSPISAIPFRQIANAIKKIPYFCWEPFPNKFCNFFLLGHPVWKERIPVMVVQVIIRMVPRQPNAIFKPKTLSKWAVKATFHQLKAPVTSGQPPLQNL